MSSFSLSGISKTQMYAVQREVEKADENGDGKLSSDEAKNMNIDSKYSSVITEGMSVSSAQAAVKDAFYGVSEQQSKQQTAQTTKATTNENQGKKLDLVA